MRESRRHLWRSPLASKHDYKIYEISSLNIFFCPGKPLGDALLFFGCRHKDEDYIYQNEMEEYLAEGTITNLFVAFSRDQVRNSEPQLINPLFGAVAIICCKPVFKTFILHTTRIAFLFNFSPLFL